MSSNDPAEKKRIERRNKTLSFNTRLSELWGSIINPPKEKSFFNKRRSNEEIKKNKLYELCEKLRERFKNINKYVDEIRKKYRNAYQFQFNDYEYFIALIYVYEQITARNPEIMRSPEFLKVNKEIKDAIINTFYNYLYNKQYFYNWTFNEVKDSGINPYRFDELVTGYNGFNSIYKNMNDFLMKNFSNTNQVIKNNQNIQKIEGFKDDIDKKHKDIVNRYSNAKLNNFSRSLEEEYNNFKNYLNSISQGTNEKEKLRLLTQKARNFFDIYNNMLDFLDKTFPNVNAYIQQNSIKPIIDKIEQFKNEISQILKLNNFNNSKRNQSQTQQQFQPTTIASNSRSISSQNFSNRRPNSNNRQPQSPIQPQPQSQNIGSYSLLNSSSNQSQISSNRNRNSTNSQSQFQIQQKS